MVTKIRFRYKGKKYVLAYTRESILEMERRGFDVFEMVDKPLLALLAKLPDFFAGAFICNHPATPRSLIDEIYSKFENKLELLDALAGMYALVIDEILDQVGEVQHGVKWERC